MIYLYKFLVSLSWKIGIQSMSSYASIYLSKENWVVDENGSLEGGTSQVSVVNLWGSVQDSLGLRATPCWGRSGMKMN